MTNTSYRLLRFSVAAWTSSLCLSAVANPIPEQFWKTIDVLSQSAPKGMQATAEIWPDRSLQNHLENSKNLKIINTEPFAISSDLRVKTAEIRVSGSDSIRLMILQIDGMCITSANIKQHYPLSKIDEFPQPNNPDPVSYRFMEMNGTEVSFEFRSRQSGCLTQVIFEPKEQ